MGGTEGRPGGFARLLVCVCVCVCILGMPSSHHTRPTLVKAAPHGPVNAVEFVIDIAKEDGRTTTLLY